MFYYCSAGRLPECVFAIATLRLPRRANPHLGTPAACDLAERADVLDPLQQCQVCEKC